MRGMSVDYTESSLADAERTQLVGVKLFRHNELTCLLGRLAGVKWVELISLRATDSR